MPQKPLEPGSILDGRYVLRQLAGRGAMAAVYLAEDQRHGSKVAVKVLEPDLAESLSLERFAREIRITAGLNHPNVLTVFDSGTVGGQPYYVMPFVEGETLRERLDRDGALPIEEALALAAEIADGLAYAHSRGFVHRDVKPSNILLAHGHAVLSDFGIARAMDAAGDDGLTRVGLSLGTASYISPEQAVGDPVDGRSDVYSLACVLYEMLAGHPPFTGSSFRTVVSRHLADTVPSLNAVRETVDPSLEGIIQKALAKVPVDRVAGAAVFRDSLRAWSAGVPLPRTRPRRRASRAVLIAGALVVVAAMVLWRFMPAGGPALDVNRVMVFPLVASGGLGLSGTVGEDVATIIGNALDGVGPLQWIDGWTQLDPSFRDDIRQLTLGDAAGYARDRGCGFFVTGRLVPKGDSAEVSLVLSEVRSQSTVARSAATGPSEEAWRVGLRAVTGMLPSLIPGGSAEGLDDWRDRNPAAIASFLLGEAAFRRIHLEEALTHYRAAVRSDSSFAVAAIRGAQAASWNHRHAEAASFIEVASQHPLSPRYSEFARGYKAYLKGRADTAIEALEEAVAIDPGMPVGWMQLGEVFTHLLPRTGRPDSGALAAFREARRLDPESTNILFHLVEIGLRRGDLAGTEPLLEAFLAAEPDSSFAGQLEIMRTCVRGGWGDSTWEDEARRRPFSLLSASFSLAGAGAYPECAERGFETLLRVDTTSDGAALGRQWSAIVGLQNVLVSQGRYDEAIAQVDAFSARLGFGTSLFLLGAPIHPPLAGRAREVADADAAEYGADYRHLPFSLRLWELGLFEASQGRTELAATVAAHLRDRARESGSEVEETFARSVEAHTALAQGDTAAAEGLLEKLVPSLAGVDELKWDEAAPLAGERLAYAGLLHARGEHLQAIEIANVLDSPWPSIHGLYLRPSLELRAAAAAALGDMRLEEEFRSRLDALQGTRSESTHPHSPPTGGTR